MPCLFIKSKITFIFLFNDLSLKACLFFILFGFVFILRGASFFKVLPCSLSSCFFIPFSIVITSLGEEGAGPCASCIFVCLFCTC